MARSLQEAEAHACEGGRGSKDGGLRELLTYHQRRACPAPRAAARVPRPRVEPHASTSPTRASLPGCCRPHSHPPTAPVPHTCSVLYIDIDVHHGDGVEEAFLTTDRVFTVRWVLGDRV